MVYYPHIMKQYFRFIIGSITSLDFYRQLPRLSLLKVALITLSVMAILAGMYATATVSQALPQKRQQLDQLIQDTTAQYPSELVVSWQDGQLTTTRPVVVTQYPQAVSSLLPLETLPAAFFSLQASEAAFLTLTATDLQIASKETQLTTIPLKTLLPAESRTVTSATVEQVLRETLSLSRTSMISLLTGGSIALALVVLVSRIAGILFEIVFFYFLQRVLWGTLSLSSTIKFLLAVSIPAEVIATIHAVALPHSTFPSYSLVLWIYLAVVLLTASSHQSE